MSIHDDNKWMRPKVVAQCGRKSWMRAQNVSQLGVVHVWKRRASETIINNSLMLGNNQSISPFRFDTQAMRQWRTARLRMIWNCWQASRTVVGHACHYMTTFNISTRQPRFSTSIWEFQKGGTWLTPVHEFISYHSMLQCSCFLCHRCRCFFSGQVFIWML